MRKQLAPAILFRSMLFLGVLLTLGLAAESAFAAPNCDGDGDGFLKDNRK
jgi:hypothetical protein